MKKVQSLSGFDNTLPGKTAIASKKNAGRAYEKKLVLA